MQVRTLAEVDFAATDRKPPELIPARVVWLPPVPGEERRCRWPDVLVLSIHKPRPPSRQESIRRKFPDPGACCSGAAASVEDLRVRYQQQTAEEGESFDAFVRVQASLAAGACRAAGGG